MRWAPSLNYRVCTPRFPSVCCEPSAWLSDLVSPSSGVQNELWVTISLSLGIKALPCLEPPCLYLRLSSFHTEVSRSCTPLTWKMFCISDSPCQSSLGTFLLWSFLSRKRPESPFKRCVQHNNIGRLSGFCSLLLLTPNFLLAFYNLS